MRLTMLQIKIIIYVHLKYFLKCTHIILYFNSLAKLEYILFKYYNNNISIKSYASQYPVTKSLKSNAINSLTKHSYDVNKDIFSFLFNIFFNG